ncbi:MAG: topoisomerase II [Proteobacteria bacterium]|nr:topoisomerase II [Pseudomonadota bacterium]
MQRIDKDTLKELEESLTEELKELESSTLQRASLIAEKKVSIQSLHGYLGGKNNHYVDSIRSQFPSPDDFISKWIQGLLSRVKEIEDEQRVKYNGNIYQNSTSHKILKLVQDPIVNKYFLCFLKRNFFRNIKERTREKPSYIHWKLWFGENQMPWGLIIAPAYRKGEWTNDVSEIRRADYQYWTIGHILSTGLIDPDNKNPIHFHDIKEFVVFYKSVLKRLSKSQYEKQIVDLYLEYLEKSSNPHDEPFLIPELRYAGLEKNHKYRLDFSVLNSHVMEFIGFELSPHSTHMAVKGIKGRKQKDVNDEIKEKWSKETSKRNEYFLSYDISTITFSDKELEDIDSCFETIAAFLQKRAPKSTSLKTSLKELSAFQIK